MGSGGSVHHEERHSAGSLRDVVDSATTGRARVRDIVHHHHCQHEGGPHQHDQQGHDGQEGPTLDDPSRCRNAMPDATAQTWEIANVVQAAAAPRTRARGAHASSIANGGRRGKGGGGSPPTRPRNRGVRRWQACDDRGMTIQVAFFRNMNLGQARSRSPRSSELLDAFAAAGATSAVNFQTNGTVIFSGPEPTALARAVVTRLTPSTGYADLVVVRPADWLIDTVGHLDPDPAGGSPDAAARRPAEDPGRARRRGPATTSGCGGDAGPGRVCAPRAGVEPAALILIQSQAGPTERPTGERPRRALPESIQPRPEAPTRWAPGRRRPAPASERLLKKVLSEALDPSRLSFACSIIEP